MKKLLIASLICAMIPTSLFAEEKYEKAWKKAAQFLKQTQDKDGSWGKAKGKVGMTAVNLEALSLAPESVKKSLASEMEKAADYLVSEQKEDGSIHDKHAPKNYCTSLSVTALSSYDKKKYAPQISKAIKWIKSIQATENRKLKWTTQHYGYGGFGYGSTTRPDLSNSWIALEALKNGGVPPKDPLWKKALIFVKRCQNSREVNDIKDDYIGNDGGAKYLPTNTEAGSPAGTEKTADGKTIYKSYGSISYGMLSAYQNIGLAKTDLPMKKIAEWCEKNFDLKRNVNTEKDGQEGLLYYYRAMAKSLYMYGKKGFAGKDWAKLLADTVIAKQNKDGSWKNPADRWTEGNPALATGYALTTLGYCQKAMSENDKKITKAKKPATK